MNSVRDLVSNMSLASAAALRDDFRRSGSLPAAHEMAELLDQRISTLRASEKPGDYAIGGWNAWQRFIKEVNEKRLRVLEVGSRVGPDEMPAKRPLMPQASVYTGLDYHPGKNVDVVGDAHRLTEILGGQKYDAIFSFSTMEHLAMPWVAALEMVKTLSVGGIMYHHVPFSWPVHELPWDFWRFTSEAYRVLFSQTMGMEIEEIIADHPQRITFEDTFGGSENFSENRSYGFFGAYMRKVREVDLSAYRWPMQVHEALGDGSHYPAPIS